MEKESWMLVDEQGVEVLVGTPIIDFRGEVHILKGGSPPHKQGSSGRVYVQKAGHEDEMDWEYFPTVFSLKWIGRQP